MKEGFNIRDFYKKHKAHEEALFTRQTGLSIRHSFESFVSDRDIEEVFAVKSISRKECFGIEFHGSISYMVPIDENRALLFIFDEAFMPIINELSYCSESRIRVFARHAPTLMTAVSNATEGLSYDYCIFVDEDMLCFAKLIDYHINGDLQNGYLVGPDLIQNITGLIQFRNKCFNEIASFDGFSDLEQGEIALRECVSFIKKGRRYVRFSDFLSSFD